MTRPSPHREDTQSGASSGAMVSRTLFLGVLVQESAFSAAGADTDGPTDRPFPRDGLGRLTLPGEGVVGALAAMASRFFDPLPTAIKSDLPTRRGGHTPPPSAWNPLPLHPLEPGHTLEVVRGGIPTEIRRGVGIRHDTGARADGVLYDCEVTPVGTRWRFVLEVDHAVAGDAADEVVGIAAYVLQEHWAKSRCWLGADVARGMGWFRLDDLKVVRVPVGSEVWPNAMVSVEDALAAVVKAHKPLDKIVPANPTRSWYFHEFRGTFGPKAAAGGYGFDPLRVGGQHVALDGDADLQQSWTRVAGELRPMVAGSSLRGPFRHAESRRLRSDPSNGVIADPNVGPRIEPEKLDLAQQLFGALGTSAALLVMDSVATNLFKPIVTCHHAEDEFSAGAYPGALYTQEVLFEGEFPFRFVVEGPTEDGVQRLAARVRHLLKLGAARQIPIGGGKWSGNGWVPFQVTLDSLVKVGAKGIKERSGGRQPSRAGNAEVSGTQKSLDASPRWRPSPTTTRPRLCLDDVPQDVREAAVAWWREPVVDPGWGIAAGQLQSGGIGSPPNDQVPVREIRVALPTGSWRAVLFTDGTIGFASTGGVAAEAQPHEVATAPRADLGVKKVTVEVWSRGATGSGFTWRGGA